MIKCFSFGKSLKQLFIISLISCFTLLVGSSVNARTYTGNTNWLIYQSVGDVEYFQNVGFKLMNYGELQSFYSTGDSYDLLYFPQNGQAYQYGNVYYGWVNNKLYYYGDFNTSKRYKTQGFIQNFCKTTTGLLFDVNLGPYKTCDYNLSAEEFYSQSHDFINIYSMSSFGSSNAFATTTERIFCLEESNGVDVYCWSCSMYDNQNNTWVNPCNSGLTGSLNFDIDVSDFSSVANIPWSFSPRGWNGNNGSGNDYITIDLTGDDYINYFENNPNYNFDKHICYVGTDDLTTTGISGIPYYEGTGKNIVQLFAHLYGNTFTTKNLGEFLNTWIINYNTWYKYFNRDSDDNPIYNAIYSLSSGFYLDYSDNLINPYLNSLTAIYFMSSLITDYGVQSSIGEEISTYCYYKLQKENPNVFVGIDITDNHDSSIDKNVRDFKRNWEKYSFEDDIVAMSWAGSDVDFFTGDENLSFNDFFTTAFNRFKDNFSVSNQALGFGALPIYIILFMLTIILFRFISH